MIKCCIFDLDGTLLNTVASITHHLNAVLADEELSPITEDECRRFLGDGAAKLVERSAAKSGNIGKLRLARVLERYNSAYDRDPYRLTLPYDGVTELLDALLERGVTLAVLSNKPDPTAVSVVREFFGDRFAVVRGGAMGVPLKPAPDSTYEILEKLDILPSELAFIGDTGVDISTGKNAGAALTVGVLWGFRDRPELEKYGADRIVSSPSELLRVLTEEA